MKKIALHLAPIVYYYFVGVGLLFTALYTYTYMMPVSHWVKYHSVEPYQQETKIGEDFYMVSDRTVHRDTDMQWLDIMMCKNNGVYSRYSDYMSFVSSLKKERTQAKWRYDRDLPTKETVCYMISNVTAVLDWGIKKKQQLVSGPFYFVK